MKYIKSITLITGLLITFYSCNRQKELYYDNKARVYFIKDSMAYSFGFEPSNITSTVFHIPVQIMGSTSSTVRSFDIEIINGKTTAKTPLHFSVPSEVKVPADSIRSYVPLTLYRNNIKENDTLNVALRIVDTDAFVTGITKPLKIINVSFNNIMEKPVWWNYFVDVSGDFHRKKCQRFIDLCPGCHKELVRSEEAGISGADDNGYDSEEEYETAWLSSQKYDLYYAIWIKVRQYFKEHPEEGITFPPLPGQSE